MSDFDRILQASNLHITAYWRNNRRLLRRKDLNPKLRTKLELLVPELEREAERRGFVLSRHPQKRQRKSPSGPTEQKGGRNCRNGYAVTLKTRDLEALVPEVVARSLQPPKAAGTNPGDLLDALERSLEQQMARSEPSSGR